MNPKFTVLSLILLSVLFALPSTSKGYSFHSLGPGKMTYVIATIAGGPQTVDPALANDAASGELIQNVYDTLVFFKGTKTSEFVPWLAESYSISADGLTYEFKIRSNVPWQEPAYGFVTSADVEYSLERILVRDYTHGPAWMLWYPIFGQFAADLTYPPWQGQAIDDAITSNATHVTVHFQTGKAYIPFLSILARTLGSMLSKQWCIDHGDWNPAVDRLDDGSWVNSRNPATSPLDVPTRAMMGSGPFKFNYLNEAVSWAILRNTAFWGGWSTERASLLGVSMTTRGYIDEIVEYFIASYTTRLAGFTGTSPMYDTITVPRSEMWTVWQQSGIKCTYPLPVSTVDGLFFSYDVGMTSPYIGSPTNATYFGQNGIRPDFFSDVHARRAVAYSINWPQFIGTAFLGEAEQTILPIPLWDAFYNNSLIGYAFNTTKAIEEWKQAWDGQVWANGFRFSAVYNEGNIPRQTVANMLKTALEAQNPLFHIDVVSLPWNMYDLMWRGGPGGRAVAPLFQVGWPANYPVGYPDVDDWVTHFIQSSTPSTFPFGQHIDMDPYSPLMDNLIEWARHNTTFEGRNTNYQQLWQLYIQQAPSVPLEESNGRRWARDWVHGRYYNPISLGVYGYSLWKEDIQAITGTFAGTHANWEDTNEDGKVDIKDLARAAKAFGAYYIQPLLPPNPFGPPGYYTPDWNSKVDVNIVNTGTGARSDMKVDIKDLAQMAKLYGFVADPWTPGP